MLPSALGGLRVLRAAGPGSTCTREYGKDQLPYGFPQDGEIIQHSPFRRQIARLKNQGAKKRDYGADEIAAVMGKRAPRRCAPTNTARRICRAGAEEVFRRNATRHNRRLSVARAVHEPTRSEREGE